MAKTATPPFRIITIATLGLLGFRPGTMTRSAPFIQCTAESSWPPCSPPADPQSEDPNEESRGQPYCHANALDIGRPNPVCLLGAWRRYLLESQSTFFNLQPPHTLRSRRDPGEGQRRKVHRPILRRQMSGGGAKMH